MYIYLYTYSYVYFYHEMNAKGGFTKSFVETCQQECRECV